MVVPWVHRRYGPMLEAVAEAVGEIKKSSARLLHDQSASEWCKMVESAHWWTRAALSLVVSAGFQA